MNNEQDNPTLENNAEEAQEPQQNTETTQTNEQTPPPITADDIKEIFASLMSEQQATTKPVGSKQDQIEALTAQVAELQANNKERSEALLQDKMKAELGSDYDGAMAWLESGSINPDDFAAINNQVARGGADAIMGIQYLVNQYKASNEYSQANTNALTHINVGGNNVEKLTEREFAKLMKAARFEKDQVKIDSLKSQMAATLKAR